MLDDKNKEQLPVGNDATLVGDGNANVIAGSKLLNETIIGLAGNDILIGDGTDVLDGIGTFQSYSDTNTPNNGYTNTSATTLGDWDTPEGYTVLDESVYALPDTGRDQVLELATDQHASYTTTVAGVQLDELLQLSFDIALPDHNRFANIDGVRVVWNGEVVLEHSPGQKLVWETVNVAVVGGSGDGTNTLTLEGIGNSNYHGAIIDNVVLVRVDEEEGGEDHLVGGEGNDELHGGLGRDWLEGGLDADKLVGGEGADTAVYNNADAAVTVNLAKDKGTKGEAKGDTYESIENVHGSDFNDVIRGDAGTNRLVGRDGDDRLIGGAGRDILLGGRGGDDLNGGSGDDDAAEYDWSTAGVTVNLTTGVGTGGYAEGDTLKNIEYVYGSHYDDSLTGDANVNRLVGDDGNDQLNGMAGNDILLGGYGADHLNGGEGNRDAADYQDATEGVSVDLVNGGYRGEADGDTYEAIEFVYGSDFNDEISGDDGINRLVGNDGDDALFGAGGNDYILAGLGQDTSTGGEGDDVFLYKAAFGNDVITDFEAGAGRTDRLWLDDLGIAGFEDLDVVDTLEGALVTVAGYGTVLLSGVSTADLVADDFIF